MLYTFKNPTFCRYVLKSPFHFWCFLTLWALKALYNTNIMVFMKPMMFFFVFCKLLPILPYTSLTEACRLFLWFLRSSFLLCQFRKSWKYLMARYLSVKWMAAQADTRQDSCYAMAIDCVGLILNAASGKRCNKSCLLQSDFQHQFFCRAVLVLSW